MGGSFSRAAEAMAYSQSGISRMVKDLENEWGFTLVERGKRGVALTSDGMAILPYVKRIVEDFRMLQRQRLRRLMLKRALPLLQRRAQRTVLLLTSS